MVKEPELPIRPVFLVFIPWAIYPDNGIANLVVADGTCGGDNGSSFAAGDGLGVHHGTATSPHSLLNFARIVSPSHTGSVADHLSDMVRMLGMR